MTQHDDRRTTMDKPTTEYLLWLDFETTGLDTAKCHLLEVAVVLTDANLVEDLWGEWLTVPRKRYQMTQDVIEMHRTGFADFSEKRFG